MKNIIIKKVILNRGTETRTTKSIVILLLVSTPNGLRWQLWFTYKQLKCVKQGISEVLSISYQNWWNPIKVDRILI